MDLYVKNYSKTLFNDGFEVDQFDPPKPPIFSGASPPSPRHMGTPPVDLEYF